MVEVKEVGSVEAHSPGSGSAETLGWAEKPGSRAHPGGTPLGPTGLHPEM